MRPLHVGERVKVKDSLEGYEEYDYPFWFTDEMRDRFGGSFVTISKVQKSQGIMEDYELHNNDPHLYKIKEDLGEFRWHSSMFDLISQNHFIHLSFL